MRIIVMAGAIGVLAGCVTHEQPAYTQTRSQAVGVTAKATPIVAAPAPPELNPIPSGTVCHDVLIKDHRIREVATVRPEALARSVPLVKGGKIVCEVDSSFRRPVTFEILRVETGSYQGALYRVFYTDGSGTVQGDPASTLDYRSDMGRKNWNMQCKSDQMDDTHWCSLSKDDLTVGIWKDGSTFISVGSSHYPRTLVTVRVDRQKPVSANEQTSFSSAQAKAIFNQLKAGKSVVTRYQEWPYQSNIDKTTDLYGFTEAWGLLNLVYKNLNTN